MRTRSRAFTLIELMVSVTVLAVLLGIGVPSFTEMIRNNRLASQTNDIVSALNFARSEALKRGLRVSVCPANGNVCSGASDWNTGILVFHDDTGTAGTLDGTDAVLQSWPANDSGLTASGAASVQFLPAGAEAAVTLNVYKSGCTGPKKREIQVEVTGRIRLTKKDC